MDDLESSREELSNYVDDVANLVREFGTNLSSLSALSRSNITDEQRAQIIRQEFEANRKKLLDKVNKSLSENSVALINFGRSLSSAPGNFSTLNSAVNVAAKTVTGLANIISSVVPVFGTIIKGVAEGVAEASKFMIDSFQQSYDIFERLTDVGVVNVFEDLAKTSNAMGLTFNDVEKVLSKSSKDLAMLGGTATAGRSAIELLSSVSENTRKNFQKLGISVSDFTEFQISYSAQQRRYSRNQAIDIRTLADGTEKYIKELDTLSKLTGVNRKQLQQEQEARLRDTRYRAGIANLENNTRVEIDKFLGIMKQTAPQVEEGMKDLIASAGAPTTEAGKALLLTMQQSGLNVQEVVKQLREGSITGYQAFQKMAEAAGKAGDATQHLSSMIGDASIITKLFVEMRELEAKRSSMTEEQYNQEQKTIQNAIEATKGQNAALAETKTSLYDAGRNIQLLAVNSTMATSAMKVFSNGLNALTEKIYELSGEALPEHLAARKEEKKLRENYNNALKNATDNFTEYYDEINGKQMKEGLSREKQIELAKKAYDEAKARRIQAEKKIGLSIDIEPKIEGDSLKQSINEKFKPQIDALTENLQTRQAQASIMLNNLNNINELEQELAKKEKDRDSAKIERLRKEIEVTNKSKPQLEKELEEANKQTRIARSELDAMVKQRDKEQLAALANRPLSKPPSASDALKPDEPSAPKPPRASGKVTRASKDNARPAKQDDAGAIVEPANDKAVNRLQTLENIKKMIADVESYGGNYNVMYGGQEANLTQKTIAEILELQKTRPLSSAMGKYQVVNETLKDVINMGSGIKPSDMFDEDTQEKIAEFLLKRRGFDEYISDPTPERKKKFLHELSREWAGLPKDESGQSYYAKDGINKSGISWTEALSRFRDGGISRGPESGYLAELHGTEAVVPLPNGMSIPVELNSDLLDELSNSMDEINDNIKSILNSTNNSIIDSNNRVVDKLETMLSMFSITASKMSDAVELLQTSKDIQRNLLNNSLI